MTSQTVELIIAALPLVSVIGLLVLRVRPLYAVIVSIILTLAFSHWYPLTAEAIRESAGSLSFSVLSAIFIMLGGIMLSEMLSTSGAQARIIQWLTEAAGRRERTILLLGIGVAPLAESVIGFGVGVITTVPLLLATGLSRTRAATVSLLGIILAPWGSMGPGLLITSGMSGVDLTDLGVWTAFLNLPVQLVMGVAIVLVGVGTAGIRRKLGETVIVTVVMWVILVGTNLWVSPSLGGILASACGIATFFVLARLSGTAPARMDRAVVLSFSPYGLLILMMACAIAVSAVIELGSWENILTGPALWIMVTAILSPFLLQMRAFDIGPALLRGLRLWFPVCSLTMLYIIFGALLSTNGMSSRLAEGATHLGGVFMVLVPVVGSVAGYVTNSGSASAALLTGGITEATHVLGSDTAVALAAQTVTTGAGIMLCPARVVVAAGIADKAPGEGSVDTAWLMKTVLGANAIVVVAVTVLTLLIL